MEEKRKEFYKFAFHTAICDKFLNPDSEECQCGLDDIWQWIEKLVEEVERETIIKEFDKRFVSESDVWKTKEQHEIDEILREPTDEERIRLGKLRESEAKEKDEEWEMTEDMGFLYADGKIIPIRKGFKLKVGKGQKVVTLLSGKPKKTN